MLEICEIEVLAKRFTQALGGAIIRQVTCSEWQALRRADLTPLVGTRLSEVMRRGKALVFSFEGPRGPLFLACRFGMSGVWRFTHPDDTDHRSFVCRLSLTMACGNDAYLVFEDGQRAGSLEVAGDLSELQSIAAFGPDLRSGALPVGWVQFCCKRHHVPIKSLLLRPEYFAGIGNRLASEVLFRASLHPEILGSKLTSEQGERLATALVLAIETSISALERGDEAVLYVYGRDGQKCAICDASIQKKKICGRSTYFCLTCQALDWQPPAPASSDFVAMVAELTGEGGDVEGSFAGRRSGRD